MRGPAWWWRLAVAATPTALRSGGILTRWLLSPVPARVLRLQAGAFDGCRVVTVIGSPGSVSDARAQIESAIGGPTGIRSEVPRGMALPPAPHRPGVPRGGAPPPGARGGGTRPQYTVDYPLRDTGVIGRIIGRGGETIKKLQQDSGTRIEVDRATDRVTIRGNDDTVSHARRMLDEICSSSRSPSRAQPNERSPSPRRWRSRSPSPQRDRRPIPARQRGRHSPPREIQRRRGSHGRSPPRQRLRHSHSRERDTQERSGTISLPPLPHAWLGSVAATAVHYEAGGQWQRETLAFLMACNPLVQPDGTEFRFPPDKMLHPPGAAGGADMGAGAPYKDVYAHFSALAARTHVK